MSEKISRKVLDAKIAKGAKVKAKKVIPKKSHESSEQKQIKLLQKSLDSTLKKVDDIVTAVGKITIQAPKVNVDVKPQKERPLIKTVKATNITRDKDDKLKTVDFSVLYGRVVKQ